ncbi:hypothetical protein AVEN_87830-1 [Araneus ventricosus]|uniref:Uncharacterized protein n=1 Tax=Araneus ventricosus TaxID=182803 RepID=A0A4Y2BBR2_ARAVE|nr:hypothetical protein AVEN_87830-1 [Araneus ventricosus]
MYALDFCYTYIYLLEELAVKIEDKNDYIVVEMRRFLKQNSTKEISPVLITILGTTVPEAIKICAKSRSCPFYVKEQEILELKCRNHITTGEARRIFQQNNAKYAETVKTMPAVTNLEDTINAKFESLLHAINDRFEGQMAIFADMLQKSMDCILPKLL